MSAGMYILMLIAESIGMSASEGQALLRGEDIAAIEMDISPTEWYMGCAADAQHGGR